MMKLLAAAIVNFNYFVGIYFGILNAIYTVLFVLSLFEIFRHIRRVKYSGFTEFNRSPGTPPVAVLIPVYNEENVVLRTVRSALASDYPYFEVIVINDGSSHGTLRRLIGEFRLRRTDRVYRKLLASQSVMGFYYNPETPSLLVVDKERGGKSDALNCGINVCRSPYFCSVDADSLLEKDAERRLQPRLAAPH